MRVTISQKLLSRFYDHSHINRTDAEVNPALLILRMNCRLEIHNYIQKPTKSSHHSATPKLVWKQRLVSIEVSEPAIKLRFLVGSYFGENNVEGFSNQN
jgi:hypothetical protein